SANADNVAALAFEQFERIDRLMVQPVDRAAILHLVHIRKVPAEIEAPRRRRGRRSSLDGGRGRRQQPAKQAKLHTPAILKRVPERPELETAMSTGPGVGP